MSDDLMKHLTFDAPNKFSKNSISSDVSHPAAAPAALHVRTELWKLTFNERHTHTHTHTHLPVMDQHNLNVNLDSHAAYKAWAQALMWSLLHGADSTVWRVNVLEHQLRCSSHANLQLSRLEVTISALSLRLCRQNTAGWLQSLQTEVNITNNLFVIFGASLGSAYFDKTLLIFLIFYNH